MWERCTTRPDKAGEEGRKEKKSAQGSINSLKVNGFLLLFWVGKILSWTVPKLIGFWGGEGEAGRGSEISRHIFWAGEGGGRWRFPFAGCCSVCMKKSQNIPMSTLYCTVMGRCPS